MTIGPHKWLSLAEFAPAGPANQMLFDLWSDVRGNRLVPRWVDFDPLALVSVVPQSIFLKRAAVDDWRALLFGSDLVNGYGREMTGANMLETLEPNDRAAAIDRLRVLVEGPAVVRSVSFISNASESPMTFEWLLLPFVDANDAVLYCVLNIALLDDVPLTKIAFSGKQLDRKVLALEFVALGDSVQHMAVGT